MPFIVVVAVEFVVGNERIGWMAGMDKVRGLMNHLVSSRLGTVFTIVSNPSLIFFDSGAVISQ